MKRYLCLLLIPSLVFAAEVANTQTTNNSENQAVNQQNTAQGQVQQDASKAVESNDQTNQNTATNADEEGTQPNTTDDSAKSQANTTKDANNNQESNMNKTEKDPVTSFLEENAKKEGVVTLNENLQYKVLEPGDGPQPNLHSSVTVHYEGTLVDGKEFDSSFKRNEPTTFSLDQVIQGWTEALPHMKTGATWMVYIGPKLAYGERGIPGVIPPNSVLVFKIKLIKVNS